MNSFRRHAWPGNIRELQNVIQRSVIICETESLVVDRRWLAVESAHPQTTPTLHSSPVQEKQVIETALAQTKGRVSGPSGAAVKLGIPPSTLESKIRSLRIDKYRFKNL